ncbi:MAG: hypothetical protein QM817_34950 [Archangium sp.]
MQSLALALGLVLMGKPVFQNKSLEELSAESELVLEVEKATPFTSTRKNAEGCEEQLWRVVVKEVLRTNGDGAKSPPKAGTTLEVIVNPTALFDCMVRKKNPNGASFSAPRFTPSASEPGSRFLFFVHASPRGFMVTVQNGWEAIEKKDALK